MALDRDTTGPDRSYFELQADLEARTEKLRRAELIHSYLAALTDITDIEATLEEEFVRLVTSGELGSTWSPIQSYADGLEARDDGNLDEAKNKFDEVTPSKLAGYLQVLESGYSSTGVARDEKRALQARNTAVERIRGKYSNVQPHVAFFQALHKAINEKEHNEIERLLNENLPDSIGPEDEILPNSAIKKGRKALGQIMAIVTELEGITPLKARRTNTFEDKNLSGRLTAWKVPKINEDPNATLSREEYYFILSYIANRGTNVNSQIYQPTNKTMPELEDIKERKAPYTTKIELVKSLQEIFGTESKDGKLKDGGLRARTADLRGQLEKEGITIKPEWESEPSDAALKFEGKVRELRTTIRGLGKDLGIEKGKIEALVATADLDDISEKTPEEKNGETLEIPLPKRLGGLAAHARITMGVAIALLLLLGGGTGFGIGSCGPKGDSRTEGQAGEVDPETATEIARLKAEIEGLESTKAETTTEDAEKIAGLEKEIEDLTTEIEDLKAAGTENPETTQRIAELKEELGLLRGAKTTAEGQATQCREDLEAVFGVKGIKRALSAEGRDDLLAKEPR
ncbi:hypothetical protein HOG48_03690 [Candidatus Peregrinibacteria bacterium]|nr:hypothetical protein [Candidatus Peregrinibacteria bacterium]